MFLCERAPTYEKVKKKKKKKIREEGEEKDY